MNDKPKSKRVDIVSIKLVKESSTLYRNRKVSSPIDAYELLVPFLFELDREATVVLTLDTKNQPTSISICSLGSINASLVHPREVFKTAVLKNANGIIIAHNHPSGDPAPSNEDLAITKRLVATGEIIGIKLVDHIIVGDGTFISLKEQGHID